MNVRDALKFIQNNSLMIISGDRDDMIKAACALDRGKLKKGCRISGIILSGGILPKRGTMRMMKDGKIPVIATREDTYAIASRVHSIVVKLKPQDQHKIKLIIDMVAKYVDIGKVLASLI